MQISAILSVLTFATASTAVTLKWDSGYDDRSRSLTAVACSDGPNGVMSRFGWKVQGDIPGFPYIGGAAAIEGYNSAACGTCYKLEYQGRSINYLAIDHTNDGFNGAQAAMKALAPNQTPIPGSIDVTVTKLTLADCGIKV